MLKLKKNVRISKRENACCINEEGLGLANPVPEEIFFNAEVDFARTTAMANTSAELRSACRTALGKQIAWWIAFAVVLILIAVLSLHLSIWFAALALVVGFFMFDDVLNLPDGRYLDNSGNVVYAKDAYILMEDGTRVAFWDE